MYHVMLGQSTLIASTSYTYNSFHIKAHIFFWLLAASPPPNVFILITCQAAFQNLTILLFHGRIYSYDFIMRLVSRHLDL